MKSKIELLNHIEELGKLDGKPVVVDDLFEENQQYYWLIFNELKDNGLIIFQPAFYPSIDGIDFRKATDNRAQLTLKGREYIEQYNEKQTITGLQISQAESVEKTNKSVRSTNNWMKFLTGLTVLVSSLSLVKQCSQETQDKLILDKFEQHLLRQDSAQQAIQRKYDSILLTNRADSLTAKQSRR